MSAGDDLEQYLRTDDGQAATGEQVEVLAGLRRTFDRPISCQGYRELRAVLVAHEPGAASDRASSK